jgi:hypothetical protein
MAPDISADATARRLTAIRLLRDPIEVRAQVAMTIRALERRMAAIKGAHVRGDALAVDACADLVQQAATLLMLAPHSSSAR